MSQNNKDKASEFFKSIKAEAETSVKEIGADNRPNILIGMATCGLAAGAMEVKIAFEETLSERKIDDFDSRAGSV